MNATSLFKAPWAPILLSAAIQSVFLLTGILAVVACMRRSSAALRHLVLFLGLASLAILPLLTRTLPRAGVHLVEFNLGAKLLVPEIGEALSSATAAKAHDPQEKTGLVSSVDLQPWRRWLRIQKRSPGGNREPLAWIIRAVPHGRLACRSRRIPGPADPRFPQSPPPPPGGAGD